MAEEQRESEAGDENGAWLEASDGTRIPIRGNLSIGRSPKNSLVLESPKISRRHAIINAQDVGEYWLIDLGSSNGTFLNKRRVHQPVRLADQDQLLVGDRAFTFCQPATIAAAHLATIGQRTVREVASVPCWLLVADIEEFTPLSRSLTNDKLATLIGGWVDTCKEIIEAHGGTIDKYLGDGFLAFWREEEDTARQIVAALAQLKTAQAREEPRFRLVLHHGMIAIGGGPALHEESLIGQHVNFVFRMEKLAGALGVPVLTSTAGKAKLEGLIEASSAGAHELKGFEGKHEFFRC